MVDLPAEVWSHIGSFARRQDLVQLALVSQLHLTAVRPILAEEVTLSNRRRSPSDHNRNLRFLVNTQLSNKIRSFSIYGFSKDEAPDVPFGAMPNLRTLHIGDCNAISAEQQKRAVRALLESCKKLRTIQISSLSTFEHKKFPVANVVTVDWNEAGKYLITLASMSLYMSNWLPSRLCNPRSLFTMPGIALHDRTFDNSCACTFMAQSRSWPRGHQDIQTALPAPLPLPLISRYWPWTQLTNDIWRR